MTDFIIPIPIPSENLVESKANHLAARPMPQIIDLDWVRPTIKVPDPSWINPNDGTKQPSIDVPDQSIQPPMIDKHSFLEWAIIGGQQYYDRMDVIGAKNLETKARRKKSMFEV